MKCIFNPKKIIGCLRREEKLTESKAYNLLGDMPCYSLRLGEIKHRIQLIIEQCLLENKLNSDKNLIPTLVVQ